MSNTKEIRGARYSLDDFVQACHEAGMKVTQQRIETFEEVLSSDDHPSAEAVFERLRKRLPSVSRDTVYRTLAFLSELGFINRIDFTSGATRYEGNTRPHHHFVCKKCGTIRDFNHKDLDQFTPPREAKAFGAVERIQIQLLGVCSRCQQREAGAGNPNQEE